MRKWNTPVVSELNITETADGFFNINWETPFDVIGHKSDKKPVTPSETPDNTGDTENDPS